MGFLKSFYTYICNYLFPGKELPAVPAIADKPAENNEIKPTKADLDNVDKSSKASHDQDPAKETQHTSSTFAGEKPQELHKESYGPEGDQ